MPFVPKSTTGGRFVPKDDSPGVDKDAAKGLDDKGDKTFKPERIPTAAGAGALMTWATPEILTGLGIASEAGGAMFPPAAPILEPLGAALTGLGTTARAARTAAPLAEAGAGALAGAFAETGAQAAEMAGGGPVTQELASIAAGLTPAFGSAALKAAARLVGFKGSAVQTLGALIDATGLREENLTGAQRDYLKRIADHISSGAPGLPESAKEITNVLERGSEQIRANYDAQAGALEYQANQIVREAQRAQEQRTAEATRSVDRLMRQLDQKAGDLMKTAEQRANAIRANAQRIAAGLRQRAAEHAPRARATAEARAKEILQSGEEQAASIARQAKEQVQRYRDVATKARETAAARATKGGEALRSVGTPATKTELGTRVRNLIKPTFDKLKKIRDENADKNKGDAFTFAELKEQQAAQRQGLLEAGGGGTVKDTKAYPLAMSLIDKELSKTTLSDIRGPLERIRQSLSGDVRFGSLERIRRFLRDRASGLPAEGYDAISQQVSGDIADAIEAIQVEYSPGMKTFLEQYKADSKPLNDYRTKLGKQIMGVEDFDWGRFTVDPANIPAAIFKSKGNVDLLIQMSGGDKAAAEELARAYVADTLQNADAAGVRRFLNDATTRDWIDTFPALKASLENAARTMEGAATVGAKRGKLSDVLRGKATKLLGGLPGEIASVRETAATQAGKIKPAEEEAAILAGGEKEATAAETTAEAEAGRVLSEAEKQRKAAESAVRRQAAKITQGAAPKGELTAAEREATRLRGEAQKLSKEGQDIADRIRGKTFDVPRVIQLIKSRNKELWAEVAPIINSDPSAQRALVDFIRQYVGQAATRSPRQIKEEFDYVIRPALEEFNLAESDDIDFLQANIDRLQKVVDPAQRVSAAQRFLMQAIRSQQGRPLSSIINLGLDQLRGRDDGSQEISR
jgi:hypothetical protein